MTAPDVRLRTVEDADLPAFFTHLQDPEAVRMAAFTPAVPSDRDTWRDSSTPAPPRSHWLGREHWGRGVATRALREFLAEVTIRPLHARAVQDNSASLRVLERCGFRVCGQDRGFANGRAAEVGEFVLVLDE